MRIFRALVLLACVLSVTGCAEVQYASHLTKKLIGPSPDLETAYVLSGSPTQQGTFKIGKPYKVEGQWYYPKEQYSLTETGIASWYGSEFHGKKTANGEKYNKNELTAAHRTLQMPSLARVTNLDNGRSVIVRVNDRGPYKRGRVMDVSEKAAELLGFKNRGTAKIRLEVLKDESLKIAQIAKQGVNTKGYEVAANQQGRLTGQYDGYQQVAYNAPLERGEVAPVAGVYRQELAAPPPVVQGHMDNGTFYPDPVVSQRDVSGSSIYVQAGSFSVYDNAAHLRDSLKSYAQASVEPALIGDRQFYRVRLGPISDVAQADRMLSRLADSGLNNAMIVVE